MDIVRLNNFKIINFKNNMPTFKEERGGVRVGFDSGNSVWVTPEQAQTSYGYAPPTATPTPAPTPTPEVQFPEIQKPATLAEIRAGEDYQAARERRVESATRLFDPLLREARAVGEAREGATGVQSSIARGLGVSSARLSLARRVQKETEQRIDDLEKKRQEYIDQGLWQEAEFMLQEKNNMIKFNNEILMQKAQFLKEEERFQKTFGLQEQQFEFSKEQAKKEMAINIANLTGIYESDPTFAAKQAEIQNALDEAQLTGIYEGEETLAAETARLDRALRERGIVIQENQLREMIRHNKASEARLAGEVDKYAGLSEAEKARRQIIDESVKRIIDLDKATNNKDVRYNEWQATVTSLVESGVYDTPEAADAALKREVGIAKGDITAEDYLKPEALFGEEPEKIPESDFETGAAQIGEKARKTIWNIIKNTPAMLTGLQIEAGSRIHNFFAGLVGFDEMTEREKMEIKRVLNAIK